MRDEIERIADVNERQRLLEQFDVFMARMARYGMLYESNPEHRTLWGLDIRVGDRVWQSHQAETEPLTVEGIDGDTFTAEGIEEPLPLRDYVRVALPGEPTFPILERIDSHNADAGIVHRLIEGDNLDALHLMTLNEASSYDAIYIDPPYGSGATEWSYNNRFVNPQDRYKNSKWLSMMSSRLAMARKLIKDDGVLIIAIDDFHMHNLRAMLDSDRNWRGWNQRVIVVRHHPQGGKDENYQKIHEYAIILTRRTDPHIELPRAVEEINWKQGFQRSGRGDNNFRNGDPGRPYSCFALLVDEDQFESPYSTQAIVGVEPPHPRNEEERERWIAQGRECGDIVPEGGLVERQYSRTEQGHLRVYPIDGNNVERVWRNSFMSTRDDIIPEDSVRCSRRKRNAHDMVNPISLADAIGLPRQGMTIDLTASGYTRLTSSNCEVPPGLHFIVPDATAAVIRRIEQADSRIDLEWKYSFNKQSDSDSVRPRSIFGEWTQHLENYAVDNATRNLQERICELEAQLAGEGQVVEQVAPEDQDVEVFRHPRRYSASSNGTKLLQDLLCNDSVFDYSKSLYTVYDLLEAVCWRNPSAKILDFFAGSGTTAHSVMLLNEVHGGNRHCTMVTNTEMKHTVSNRLWREGVRPLDQQWLNQANSRLYTFERCRLAANGNNADGNNLGGNYSVLRPGEPDLGFPMSDGFPTQGIDFLSLRFIEPSSVRRGDWHWGEDIDLLASIYNVHSSRFRMISSPAEIGELEECIANGEVIELIFVNSYEQDFYDLVSNRFASQGIIIHSLGRYQTHFRTRPIPRHSGGIVR